jgi:hypothetical protein
MDTAIGIGIMLTGLPVYFLFIQWRGKLKSLGQIMGRFSNLIMFHPLISFIFRRVHAVHAKAVAGGSNREKRELNNRTKPADFTFFSQPNQFHIIYNICFEYVCCSMMFDLLHSLLFINILQFTISYTVFS